MRGVNIISRSLTALFLLGFIITTQGQKLTSSPWSRYGFGEWQPNTFSQSFAMAGTGIGITDPAYINFQNPASYGWFDMTLFDTGIKGTSVLQESEGSSQWRNNTSFSHVSFGFPVTRWWGLNVGLSPYAGTGYKITETQNIQGIGLVTFDYEGSGGINRAWIGNGFTIKEKLAIGANVSYLFGTSSYDKRAIFTAPNTFNSRIREEVSVHDFAFNAGIQYKARLSENWSMAVGGTYELGSSVSADRYLLSYTYEASNTGEILKDTIQFLNGESGEITLPSSLGAGISFTSDKWIIALDARSRSWSELTSFELSDSLKDNIQVAAGVQFIPDKFAVNDFFRSMRYRGGIRYTTSQYPTLLDNMDEVGISFGFGIPLRQSLSTINAGVELSQRGSTHPGMLRERFIRFNFAVSLNDRWFIKRKYN